jgi:FlgD Ig-like domain
MASASPRPPLPVHRARCRVLVPLSALLLAPLSSAFAGDTPGASALLETFRCAFAPGLCGEQPGAKEVRSSRCFQGPVAEFARLRPDMTPGSVAEIESYLRSRRGPRSSAYTYISPAGLFEFTYETTGPDSVRSDDVDPPNGIPDFVERCAEYADQSWAAEGALGFVLPELPGDGTYDISYQALGTGFYGYTDLAGNTTTIVLNSTFEGALWPPNDDPDGNVLGRAKATIAHELRHASQYTNNGWSEEPHWEELDAAWVEDIVYPLTNDYVNFLGNLSLSQLDAPWIPMDSTSTSVRGYEDCLWQHSLSGTYGTALVRELWDLRAWYPSDPMFESYAQVLAQYGTSWHEAYPKYLEWCWFTGTRAIPGVGFADAASLWTMEVVDASNTYPYSAAGDVEALAGHPRRFRPGNATGYPIIHFDGENGAPHLTLSVIVVEPDPAYTVCEPPLDEDNDCEFTVPLRFPDLKHIGVIVTNTDSWGGPASYSLLVEDHPATAIGPGGGAGGPPVAPVSRLELLPPDPNPSRGASRLRWTQPRSGPVTLRIVDLSGRVVRTLLDDTPSATKGAVTWDGRDANGRPVPAGVYWAHLAAPQGTAARRIVRLR